MLERLIVNLSSGLILIYLALYAIPEWKEKRAEKERLDLERIEEYDEYEIDTDKSYTPSERSAKYIDTQQLTQLWQDIKSELAAESSGGYIDEITDVTINRSGKVVFTLHVHPISDKDFNSARLLATNNDGELDTVLLKSGIIYLATTKEDREAIWDNIEIRKHFTPQGEKLLAPVETIDKLLTVGEKYTLTEEIMKISGMNAFLDDTEEDPQDEPEPEQAEEKEEKLEPCPICHSEVKAEIERWPGHCKLTIVCEKCGLRFENSQEFREVVFAGGEVTYIPTTLHPVVIWNDRARKEG